MNYSIVDVKQAEEEISFCVVVNDDPDRKDIVYVFEDVRFIDTPDGGLEIGVNMAKLTPGSGVSKADEIPEAEIEFMQNLLTLMIEDFVDQAAESAPETTET